MATVVDTQINLFHLTKSNNEERKERKGGHKVEGMALQPNLPSPVQEVDPNRYS